MYKFNFGRHALIKLGLLMFSFTIIISFHLSNNTFYYIKSVGERKFGEFKIDASYAKTYNIPTNKYLSYEEYLLVKDLPLVAFNTTIHLLPFEASKSLFVSLFLMLSIGIIIFNVNINNKHSQSLMFLIFLSLIFYFIYNNLQAAESKINERISRLELQGDKN